MYSNIFNGLNWGLFRDLEDKVISSTQFVDLAEPNLNVFSREFANLLFQICTNIEATFKAMLRSPSLQQDSVAQEKERKDNNLNISDYKDVFEKFYRLSECEVIIAPHDIKLPTKPFQSFSESKLSPKWWKSYNEIKHDLSANFHKATLGAVIHSLSGLFLLNVVHLEARDFIIENKIFKSYDAEYAVHPGTFKVEQLKKNFSKPLQHFDIEVPGCVVFTSKLFLFQPGKCGMHWDEKNVYWFRYL